MLAADASGGDNRAPVEHVEISRAFCDQDIFNWSTWKDAANLEAGSRFARQILCAMHSDIDFSGQKRALNLAREEAFAPVAQVFNLRVIGIRELKTCATFIAARRD